MTLGWTIPTVTVHRTAASVNHATLSQWVSYLNKAEGRSRQGAVATFALTSTGTHT